MCVAVQKGETSVTPKAFGVDNQTLKRIKIRSGRQKLPFRLDPAPPSLHSALVLNLKQVEVWFVTGSQHLYGADALRKVAANAQQVAATLDASSLIPAEIVCKPVVKSAVEATALCQQASVSSRCIGLITWCHTFSPSKMWINGLKLLRRPLLHFHTQHNRDIPWATIDMDFMNLNQAAHGDREHGFIMSRMRLNLSLIHI